MGSDNKYWASQLSNDLENFYNNEGLKLTGGFSLPTDLAKFKLIMYNVEMFERSKKFDLEVEAVHGDLSAKQLQDMLNDKYFNEHKILRAALNVYDRPNKSKFMDVEINTHLLIFQDLSINLPVKWIDADVMFWVVNMLKLDRNKNPAESMQLFIKETKRKKDLFLVTIIPNTRMSNSLLVFMKRNSDPDAGSLIKHSEES